MGREFKGGPPLKLALLFGSVAKGAARPDSDIDVAIIPRDEALSLGAELDLQAALSAACGRPVDLVRLDRASTLMRWQVARDGVVLLAEPAVEHSRFRARAGIEHADFNLVRDPAAERFRQRMAALSRSRLAT